MTPITSTVEVDSVVIAIKFRDGSYRSHTLVCPKDTEAQLSINKLMVTRQLSIMRGRLCMPPSAIQTEFSITSRNCEEFVISGKAEEEKKPKKKKAKK